MPASPTCAPKQGNLTRVPSKRTGESREKYNARMAAYMKSWYDRRRAGAVAALGGHCARCPETEGLEFDHVNPATKTMNISKMWTAPEEKFQFELAKCQLLCRPHHIEKTLNDRGLKAARGTHGTLAAYRYCGPPKCEECKAVKHDYYTVYKLRERR
jgi:5-methylcytosine-specific restriction endonuclease McrA